MDMAEAQLLAAWFGSYYLAAARRVRGAESDRGDVPGWVMITVMSAGLVVIIFGVFKSKITDAISHAIDSVTGQTNQ
jgi:Na+/H+ antiporter NhaD/arsenite permease-like protein